MRKRANHEGNITHRKNEKRWKGEIMIGYYDDGRPRRISVYGKTRAEVIEKLDAIKRDLKDDISVVGIPTVQQVSEIYMKLHRSKISATTYKSYEYLLKPILEEFGTCKVSQVTTYQLDDYLLGLVDDGYSSSYLSKIVMLLREIFRVAKKYKWIRHSPVDDIEDVQSRVAKKEKEYFTINEMEKLNKELPIGRTEDSIRLLVATALRPGELLATTENSFEADGSVIHVRTALKYVGGQVTVGCPKTKTSIRDVVVPPPFRPAAKRLRELCNGGYLWEVGVKGQPCHPSHFRNEFKRAVESVLGPTTKTPYAARHGCATAMAASGVPATIIQQVLGHASVRVTNEVYIHRINSAQYDAANAMGQHFTTV